MKIFIIQTGGTIDKDYPKQQLGYAFEITEPAAERILKRVNPAFEFEIIPLIKKDSLDLTDDDREQLLQVCRRISLKQIVITHGTDSIIKTAEYLSVIRDKTIILTGAFRPEKFYDSDAGFNLGLAIGAVQLMPPSVYIALSGRIFKWDEVDRHPETGQFILRAKKDKTCN